MKEKVKTIVLKVSDNTKEKMIEYFKDKTRIITPPYAVFQADEADTVVTLYNSNKVVFQGISADIDANMWNEMEMHLNKGKSGLVEKKGKEKKEEERKIPLRISSVGSDEVGTGDFFGPIAVSATYVSKENLDFLLDLKVKDSKKLTDIQIIKVVPEIIKKIPYKTLVLHNKDYNKYYGENMNMNKIKAILHNKVLYELLSTTPCTYDHIVVDQFVYPKKYYEHIEEAKYKVKGITFLTKAEDQVLSVACASMISRYIFLNEMNKLSKEVGIILPKGASSLVDDTANKIKEKYGIDKLYEIAKMNFKNAEKLK